MLSLSRQVGQEIVIDGNIRLTITSVEGQPVRLGISAPSHVRIRRREVISTPSKRGITETVAIHR
jgi:carbon storage regulator